MGSLKSNLLGFDDYNIFMDIRKDYLGLLHTNSLVNI